MNNVFSEVAPWPYYSEEEVNEVSRVLRSGKVNYWTGDIGKEFEKEFAKYVDVPYAIAVSNGTVALELALYALGIKPGDEVITTSRTYIASASCIVMRGALPVIVDVDKNSQNISPAAIKKAVTPKTRAVIVVHLAGWPCEMDEIMSIAEEYNLKVIEDCAQASGATYKGRPVGSFGHASAFSFCQDKIMSTGGEGGMFVTKDEIVWKKAWAYKDIGRSYDAVYNRQHPPGFRWLTESFGTNFRMTEIQAAIGRIQLRNLDKQIEIRRHNASLMTEMLSEIKFLRLPKIPNYIGHAFYKYYLFVKPEMLNVGWSRDRILEEITNRGIPAFVGSCSEIYLEKAFDSISTRPEERLAVAKELGETSMMFLIHPTISVSILKNMIAIMKEVFHQAEL